MSDCTVFVVRLDPKAKLPARGTPFAAGADLYVRTDEPLTIPPGGQVMIHTGLAISIPAGHAGLVFARSGLATKKGLAPANKVGIIDSDYRGELMVPLFNHSEQTQMVEDGERVAQLVVVPFLAAAFQETDALDETGRGDQGFGSTGAR